MYKISIINVASQLQSHGGQFELLEESQAWIAEHSKMGGAWGNPEHTIQVEVTPYSPAVYEEQSVLVKEAILDEQGEELEPAEFELQQVLVSPEQEAVFEDQVVPSEFEVDGPHDISAELEQAQINADSLKFLAESDFRVLRHIRQKALGETLSLSEEQYLALEQSRSDAAGRVI